MARPSTVIPRIIAKLEEFRDLNGKIPATNDGKVNVAALCRELNLREDDVQHFHKKDEIKDFVNDMALGQGLLPIGHRAFQTTAEMELEERMRHTAAQAKEDAQSAVEANAARETLFQELKSVRAELTQKDLEIASLKERLRLIEEGGLFVRL